MSATEQVITRNMNHVLENQPKNTCVMLDDNGQEVKITKDMVVNMCHELLNQCRNVKN
ncbi:PA1571 family protein [Acinetobacter sichuanensis]|nr:MULTISPECIES: PA1571 family protein [Acinetobacter]MDM1248355.1 hypothetical protein [Acinetobacter sp. R933-2]MDM1763009.1 hypothetical protein [Acinetobacter sp. 226-1]MDM1766488.1 hypothetical protein [Acinetobacter sp. 226-4]MDQ9020015.1 hypothetical protein [Acinetobacter sichuanensis]